MCARAYLCAYLCTFAARVPINIDKGERREEKYRAINAKILSLKSKIEAKKGNIKANIDILSQMPL